MEQEQLKQRIKKDMIDCMRAKDKARLPTIRLLIAAIKQREIDERIELSDTDVMSVIEKMIKQRHESVKQYTQADRTELAEQESAEIKLLQYYLPTPLSSEELAQLVEDIIASTQATSLKDMGPVMAAIKKELKGRADMSTVSALVKKSLS